MNRCPSPPSFAPRSDFSNPLPRLLLEWTRGLSENTLDHIMAAKKPPTIPLPEAWTEHVRTAMLHVISLAQYATAYTRSWAADSANGRTRIKAESDRAQQEILLFREIMRSKDARMALISPHRRPYYPPSVRLASTAAVGADRCVWCGRR